MLRDVKHVVTDGLLGFDTTKGVGLHVKVGPSPVTANAPLVITGNLSAGQIRSRLGHSPLADKVMDSIQFGSSRIFCIPVAATTPGTVGAVKKSGTGTGSVALEGSPTNTFQIVVKITGQGGLNSALFAVSVDGGQSYDEERTIPTGGAYELDGTGLKLKFTEALEEAALSFQAGDLHTCTTTAPAMTNGDVLGALEKLKTFSEVYEHVHIVGGSGAGLWQAVGTFQKELQEVYHKPVFFLLEAAAPTVDEDLTDYALRLEAERKGVKNYSLQVCAARGMLLGMDGVMREDNLAGVVAGLYARTAVHVSIGKTREEAGLGIPKTKLSALCPPGVEDCTELLDLAGFLTFREYDGMDNFYVYHAKMLAPDGSDYRYAEDVRVLNKIIRETRREGLKVLGDDIDLEDVQGELEARAKFMDAPLQRMKERGEISGSTITIPEGQAETILEDETMRVQIRYLSRGYLREVLVDLGRTPPGD